MNRVKFWYCHSCLPKIMKWLHSSCSNSWSKSTWLPISTIMGISQSRFASTMEVLRLVLSTVLVCRSELLTYCWWLLSPMQLSDRLDFDIVPINGLAGGGGGGGEYIILVLRIIRAAPASIVKLQSVSSTIANMAKPHTSIMSHTWLSMYVKTPTIPGRVGPSDAN